MRESFRQMHSSVGDINEFNGLVGSLEKSERRRFGKKKSVARKDIARDLGITKSALEGLRSRRTKTVPGWLKDRIRALLIQALQGERQNIEHEINLHKQAGAHPSSNALAEAEAHLCALRAILNGEMKT